MRKTIFVSLSFHISVTSVSPGSTVDAKRTLMLLTKSRVAVGRERLRDVRASAKPNEHRPWRIGSLEAERLREAGIGVQRVPVAGQAIEQRLVLAGLLLDDLVGRAIGRDVDVGATGRARRPSRRRRARTW